MVEEPPIAFRREEAERDPDRHREQDRRQRQLDRRGEAQADLLCHVPVRGRADPEVAVVQRRPEVPPVLDRQRLVEPVLMAIGRDELRGRALTEERLGRPAGQRPDPEEDQERNAEQDRDEQQQPADEKPEH